MDRMVVQTKLVLVAACLLEHLGRGFVDTPAGAGLSSNW
jgi:hypothetical protein